eukprot:gene24691-29834_t
MWGLMRSIRFTIDSYRQYVLAPVSAMNHTYEVIVHTYKLQHAYSNARNLETSVWINETDWRLLRPNYVHVEQQEEFDVNVNYPLYQSKGDYWDNNYLCFKNHMRALNSLHHVTLVVQSLCQSRQRRSPTAAKCFDAIIFLRPDVEFLHPLPVHLLNGIGSNRLYVPDFHRSCRQGEYNDRMAMGGLSAALTYGKKLQRALSYSQKHIMHAEGYTYDYLHGYKELEVIEIPFRFRRMRSTGAEHFRDKQEVYAPYLLQPIPYLCSHPYSFYAWAMSVGRTFYILLSQVYYTVNAWRGSCMPNQYMTPNDVYLLESNHCSQASHSSSELQVSRNVSCKHKHAHMCIKNTGCSVLAVPHNCRYSLLKHE